MTEMRQYVCWTGAAVRATSPLDAASLGSGHFQAVHHPLRPRQRPVGSDIEGRWVEEAEIVRVLEGPLRPDGYLLIPIVGGSGTGKSHLVRWVRNRTKDHHNWESRYLAKNRTSIRRVIETVIEGLEGPAIEAAREALLSAPAQSEKEEVLAERLLDELALITSAESATDFSIADRRAAQMVDKLRSELPDILRDPVVRRRLTGDGAVIPRLVGLAMRGRRDGDGLDDNAIRITDDDLPLTFAEIGEASKGARTLLGKLASISDLRSRAVGLINEALPSAVKRVFVSDQVDLIAVLREVRRELLVSGKELVLFIEDLTVLHGVEREFLDAIIEPVESPNGTLCSLRVLFAVTEGHFIGLDTVRTRCNDAYRLDSSYGPEGVSHDEVMSFLGRYLNACRIDPSVIEDRWANRQGDAWMPNACDLCDHQVHCHATFGQSEEGYGLYPYNPAAVNRFMESLSIERFDPRVVVRELVNRFLIVAAADLQRGEFPSNELIRPFNERSASLDPLVHSELRSRRAADFERVANSMRYWGDSFMVVGDATLSAFGLDALGDLNDFPTPRSPTKGKPTSRGTASRSRGSGEVPSEAAPIGHLRSPWLGIFDELNTWAGNQRDLGATTTNRLKKLVHKSILDNLDFSALPTNLGPDFDGQKRFDHQRHIHIAGSMTDQSLGNPIVTIEQDAPNAAALQGLILLTELQNADDYSGAGQYRRRAAQFVEEWMLRVTARLEQPPEPSTTAAITGLLVCALVSDACGEASEPRHYLGALFGSPSSPVDAQRSQKWKDAVRVAHATYGRLRPVVEAHFGEARGRRGAARGIRADQILKVIQDFVNSGHLESTDAATDRFMRSVTAAVEIEWRSLEESAAGAAPLVDPDRPWSEQRKRVLGLVESAHRMGRLRDHHAARDLRELASSLDDDAHRVLRKATELVRRTPPLIERLKVVASSLPDTVTTVNRFVIRAEQAMSEIAWDLDERRAGQSEDETLEDVAADVLSVLGRLEKAVEELGK